MSGVQVGSKYADTKLTIDIDAKQGYTLYPVSDAPLTERV